MKKENRISLVTLLIGFLIFLISSLIQNQIAKAVLSLIGISVIVISIVYEKKSKESEKLWDFANYKVNNPKVKEQKKQKKW